jgi:hypothetical protein
VIEVFDQPGGQQVTWRFEGGTSVGAFESTDETGKNRGATKASEPYFSQMQMFPAAENARKMGGKCGCRPGRVSIRKIAAGLAGLGRFKAISAGTLQSACGDHLQAPLVPALGADSDALKACAARKNFALHERSCLTFCPKLLLILRH